MEWAFQDAVRLKNLGRAQTIYRIMHKRGVASREHEAQMIQLQRDLNYEVPLDIYIPITFHLHRVLSEPRLVSDILDESRVNLKVRRAKQVVHPNKEGEEGGERGAEILTHLV